MRCLLFVSLLLLCAFATVERVDADDVSGRPERSGAAIDASTSVLSVDLSVGLGGFLSDWRDDGGGGGALKLGARLWDTLGLHALTRLGYASVDQRLLTFLSISAQLWPVELGSWSPYLRIAGFHQHEESMAAVDQNPGGAVFGVGDGIRHRYGAEAALGSELQLLSMGSSDLYAAAELTGSLAFESSGPDLYMGLFFFFGLEHQL